MYLFENNLKWKNLNNKLSTIKTNYNYTDNNQPTANGNLFVKREKNSNISFIKKFIWNYYSVCTGFPFT